MLGRPVRQKLSFTNNFAMDRFLTLYDQSYNLDVHSLANITRQHKETYRLHHYKGLYHSSRVISLLQYIP